MKADRATLAALYRDAQPFRHVVVDEFIARPWADKIAEGFPPPTSTAWHTFTGPLEAGKQEGRADIAGKPALELHSHLASRFFVGFLRAVTGIPDLVADPDRIGGGVHQSGPGARLALHVDFNLHPTRPELVRAVNVIVFLTDGADHPEDGGYLQLHRPGAGWNAVRPDAGRLVIFEAGDDTYHGHPIPLVDDAPLRRSLPAYYYRPVRDGETIEPRSTRFLDA